MSDDVPDRVAAVSLRLDALYARVDGLYELRAQLDEIRDRIVECKGAINVHRDRLTSAETRIGLLRDQVDAMALTDSDDDVRIEDRVEALERRLSDMSDGFGSEMRHAAQTTVTFDDLRRVICELLRDEYGNATESVAHGIAEINAIERERKEQTNIGEAAVPQAEGGSDCQPSQGGLRSDHAHPAVSPSLADAIEALRKARTAPYAIGERAARERYTDGVVYAADAVLAAWDAMKEKR